MTWTYSGLPGTTGKEADTIRFLIGDTNPQDQQVSDEEIAFALTQESNLYKVAAVVLRAMQARFAREADCSVGDVSKSSSQIAKALAEKAKEYDKYADDKSKGNIRMFVGGISWAEKHNLDEDSDAVRPELRIRNDDFPNANPKTYANNSSDRGDC